MRDLLKKMKKNEQKREKRGSGLDDHVMSWMTPEKDFAEGVSTRECDHGNNAGYDLVSNTAL